MKVIVIIFLSVSFSVFSQEKIENKVEMCSLLRTLRANDMKYRQLPILKSKGFGHTSNFTKHEKDSVWRLQRKLDVKNTKTLLQLTRKYGWLSDERVDCSELDIWLIFRHSDKPYFAEILEVIEKEHSAKRLNTFQFNLIKHQINGRPR